MKPMGFLDELFKSRELYLLTGGDGRQVHLGFVDGRRAVYFFTSAELAKSFIRSQGLRGEPARVNWKAFDQMRADLAAAHVRQAAIDPAPGSEAEALCLPIEQVRIDNAQIWGQPAP
jgi:hypothetical protein